MTENKRDFVGCNVIVRIVKPYPGARNHVYTGKVVDYDGRFVALDGGVLHFGKPTVDDPTGGLTTSPRAVRWLALQRIEYIRELPEGMDPFKPDKFNVSADGSIAFKAIDRPDLLPE